ncbi:hypothetical protein Tco_0429192 [Tanacetum coccineum]
MADEVAADNIIDELITEANKEDTNVFAATTNEVSSEYVPQSASTLSSADVKAILKPCGKRRTSLSSQIVSESIARQLPDLLIATIKNTLPQALTTAVREILPKFNKRIRNSIKDEMPEVLTTSVLNPMY